MNEIGLKLWNINTDFYLKEAQKLYAKGVFDYIELYIVPQNLNKIKEWKKLAIPFNIHAPHSAHNMNLSKKANFENNLKLYQEVNTYANELNAKYIIFHGGVDGDYEETAKQLKYFNDSRILIENKPYKVLPFIDGDHYIGAKIDEIKYIMDFASCGFCFDVGHAITSANSFNIEPYKYIEEYVKLSPSEIHLSDINMDTEIDEHLNYGEGNLNFKKLFEILPKNLKITIETKRKSNENLDDFVLDAKYLKGVLK